jgi:hypothetical protein
MPEGIEVHPPCNILDLRIKIPERGNGVTDCIDDLGLRIIYQHF